ncbi:amidohydrolase [Microbacterium indicum]|uniref:amidohydrolase n=1 Tax=Microbacterium indicum TaxID=358100 RepID=UPI000A064F44|nr:amidohydrolase family protein [Microbacterium indicum]
MSDPRSTVYRPGGVVTMDPGRPHAEAFAVCGDRLTAVGTFEEVREVAGLEAEVVELDGVVLPGLIDAHMHMQRAGLKALDYVDEGDDVERYIDAMRDSFDDDGPEHPPFEDRIRALVRVQPLLHSLGFTSIVDPAVSPDEFRGYQESRRRGLLTMRTVMMPWHDLGSPEIPDVDAVIARLDGIGLSTGFGDDLLRVGPIKVYADGEALKGQALLEEPWDDSGYRGVQRISDEDFARLVRWCAEHGWGVGAHAVGGAAVSLVARTYAAEAAGAIRDRRHQLIHAYLEPSAETMALAAREGIIASLQPGIAIWNAPGLREKLGARAERIDPVRSWIDSGAPVAFGSDGPFFAFDPRHLIWHVVTRQIDGHPPLDSAEAITVSQALAAYTTGAAYAAMGEESQGMLRAGRLADWALWSDDPTRVPIDDVRRLTVRRTVVGGRTVYRRAVR